jgi:hypothetical protein
VSEASPAEVVDGPFENDSFGLEVRNRGLQVVAHQIELVVGFFGGVKGDLGRGQGEDQPAVTGVDGVETEDVLEEFAVCFRVFGVDDYVGARNHALQFRTVWNGLGKGSLGEVWVVVWTFEWAVVV